MSLPQENNLPVLSIRTWLVAARLPYLTFLRNLPAQVALASMTWFLASRLNFLKVDVGNVGPTLGFFAFLVLFVYAVYANVSLFMEELFPGFMDAVGDHEKAIKASTVTGLNIPIRLVQAVIKERGLELVLGFVALIAVDVALAGVFVSSIFGAVNLLQAARN